MHVLQSLFFLLDPTERLSDLDGHPINALQAALEEYVGLGFTLPTSVANIQAYIDLRERKELNPEELRQAIARQA